MILPLITDTEYVLTGLDVTLAIAGVIFAILYIAYTLTPAKTEVNES